MAKILTLATARLQDGQIAGSVNGQYPRVDYLEMQNLLDMDVLDYAVYDRNPFGKVFQYCETKLRSDLYLTMSGLLASGNYDVTFAMSERTGTPYSGLHRLIPNRTPFVTMFQCWSNRQERVITSLNLLKAMDSIIVHCQSMKDHLIGLGSSHEDVHVIHFGVDHHFFSPRKDVQQEPGFILSLGETRSRDYKTLIKSVSNLSVNLLIAASGRSYAREKKRGFSANAPKNVTISGGFPSRDLRNLYARAQFVTVPVYDLIYSAGSTAVLESMCMERAVIVSSSPGISDYVIDGETGILVEPGDEYMWREAIQYLLAHPAEARRMGQNARQRVEEELNMDIYIEKIAQLLTTFQK